MNSRRIFVLAWVMAIAAAIGGCATSPYEGDGKTKSDAMLQAQFQQAEQQRAGRTEGQIIFAGFAMNSKSKAFRNDVLAAEKFVKNIDPNAIVFKLDNPAWGQGMVWPYATAENIVTTMGKVTALARPQDKVVILMSTHGNVDLLSINFDEKYYPHIDSKLMQRMLFGLRGKPTLLILSACYSGSFVQPLAAPNRIILTASAKDRNSFGCNFHSDNTFFVRALLNQPTDIKKTLVQMTSDAQKEVDRLEKAMKLSPPSLPQVSVGPMVESWANRPLADWLTVR
jgi:hypothetical protein